MIISPDQKLDAGCATVLFLLNKANESEFYLAQKKQDIHKNNGEAIKKSPKMNGYGGKWEEGDESIFHTATRETFDECGVAVKTKDLIPVGQVEFFWPGNVSHIRDMEVFFFLAKEYVGVPVESKEMGLPKLFSVNNAPYKQMMPADEFIVRNIMNSKIVTGRIHFTEVNWSMAVKLMLLKIKER
ncbi:MAG: NUDIX domain-containing protein [Candidatus Paceibacterota bacterium]